MAIGQSGEHDEVLSEINVTPLVDVMLVLLVVFIVTAPLLTNAIHVNLPKTDETAAPDEPQAMTLSVNARGEAFLDKEAVPFTELEARLKSAHERDPEMALYLQADTDARYGAVAKAMAAIERAGLKKVAVITEAE